MRRVAVIGSGISGLSVAHALAGEAQVILYEAGDYFGGHTHTVDVTLDGITHGVDTGFLVLNERTYPNLLALFARLEVEIAKSDMSFSVQVPDTGLEWSGCDLDTVFAQRANLLRPRFWGMLVDLLRFNRLATRLAESGAAEALDQPIGDFLDAHRFGAAFRDWYFLPMIGCIWSCPVDQMLRFPVATMLRFCHNHGLLQVADRPQWYTVRGGAREYVRKMIQAVPDARLRTPVRSVERGPAGVRIATDHGSEHVDAVVLACHSDQALALLAAPSAAETRVLGAIRYQDNRAVLHTDTTLLPRRRKAWAAWNYERPRAWGGERIGVPALPARPPAAAAVQHAGGGLAQPVARAARRQRAGRHGLRPSGLRRGGDRGPTGPSCAAGAAGHLVLRRLDALRLPRGRPAFRPGGAGRPAPHLGRPAGRGGGMRPPSGRLSGDALQRPARAVG